MSILWGDSYLHCLRRWTIILVKRWGRYYSGFFIFSDKGVNLEQEDGDAGFLGVKLERYDDTGLIEMRQDGIFFRVIKKFGIDCQMDFCQGQAIGKG